MIFLPALNSPIEILCLHFAGCRCAYPAYEKCISVGLLTTAADVGILQPAQHPIVGPVSNRATGHITASGVGKFRNRRLRAFRQQ